MNKKTFFRWWFLLLVTAVISLACNLTGDSETPAASEVPTEEIATTVESERPTDPPPTVLNPPATLPPVAATATLASESEPEPERPTPTSETAEPEPTVTLSPASEPTIAAPGTIAPGQQTTAALESNGRQLFTFEAVRFEPVIVFVEGDDELDIVLSAYQGAVAVGTDLGQLQPISEGDFNGAGRPEILVISPDTDGPLTIAVQGNQTAGNFTMYMYDGTTPAANTRLVNDSLEAGQTNIYKALSNDGRPVILFVDPTDQSDVVLQVQFEGGELITEANFGGDGSAETAYVLPTSETAYSILVSEANGQTAVYNLVIVTLPLVDED